MYEEIIESPVLWIVVTVGLYLFAAQLKKRWPRNPLFVPLLFAIVGVIIILMVLDIPLATYSTGGDFLRFFITPATVCLGVKLEKNFDYLARNYKAILIGIFSGVIFHTTLIYIFSLIFGFGPEMIGTLIPKTSTTAIALGVSESLGGIVPMTVALVIFTGILGAVLGEHVFRIFGINDPVAQGIAMGTSSHAMGTTGAIQQGDVQGAMSGLAEVMTGVTIVAIAPLTLMLTEMLVG